MRPISHKIHLFLSIPFGLLVTLICATGAMLALQDDIIRFLNLDYYYVEHKGTKPHDLDVIVKKVMDTVPDSIRIAGVEISADPRCSYRVKLSDADKSTVFVDQYTTEILGTRGETRFFAKVKQLHRTLLDSRPTAGTLFHGKYITGITAIAFIAIIITGLAMWLPARHQSIRKTLCHPMRSGWRRVNKVLHGTTGTFASIFLLTMALTGLTWSFQWYKIAFYNLFGATASVQNHPAHIDVLPDDPRLSEEILHGWKHAFKHLEAAENGYDVVALSPHEAFGYYLSNGNTKARDYYLFDNNGEIKNTKYYRDAKPDTKLRGWIYSVHTGSFGGIVTRIIWALAALTGALLPIGGYIIWWRRITRRRGAHRCNDGCNKARMSDSR